MPNNGHRWTEKEERAALELEWDEFSRFYPGITRDAYRIRRQSLRRQAKAECRVCRMSALFRRLHSHA